MGAVAVDSHPGNFHLTCEAPLFAAPRAVVPAEAIALQYHDPEEEQAALIVPPVTGGPSVIPASSASGALKALAGPSVAPVRPAPFLEAEISVTEAGEAPPRASAGDQSVLVQRRSMESRRGETISVAAVTPQAFLDQVNVAVGAAESYRGGGSTTSVPKSFGPEPKIEEC